MVEVFWVVWAPGGGLPAWGSESRMTTRLAIWVDPAIQFFQFEEPGVGMGVGVELNRYSGEKQDLSRSFRAKKRPGRWGRGEEGTVGLRHHPLS